MDKNTVNETTETLNIAAKTSTWMGILTVVVGIIALGSPMASGVVLTYMIGFLLIGGGITRGIYAFKAGSLGKGILMLAFGAVTVIAGFVVVANPILGLATLTIILFAYFLVEGITGIILLLGPVFKGGGREFWSGLAILTAASCYAVNSILIKRLPRFNPMVGACGVLLMASLIMLQVWLLMAPENNSISQHSMLAVVWLCIGPTGIATIILFLVIDRAGPTFLSTINYMIPVVAFLCGAWLLSEPVTWQHFVALATILGGIGITRIRVNRALRWNCWSRRPTWT